ncbi:DEAD-domain-containing protein [Peniophora sp. CONT]|nr:DEAD-domain-containing protein [Peniophora sp. CONT]
MAGSAGKAQRGTKRKSSGQTASRKKVKTSHSSLNDLPWKSVSNIPPAGLDFDENILDLEEVDNVEVVYEETSAGRIVKFNVLEQTRPADAPVEVASGSEGEGEEAEDTEMPSDGGSEDGDDFDLPPDVDLLPDEDVIEAGPSGSSATLAPTSSVVNSFDAAVVLPEWASFELHPQLARALHGQKFVAPTPIQKQTLPHAISGRDVIGVAETGSGKTLAYGLPILHALLSHANAEGIPPSKTRRPTRALIVAPTRELALQVSSHLNACLNEYSEVKLEEEEAMPAGKGAGKKGKGKGKQKKAGKDEKSAPPAPRGPPPVSVAAIVGGMSPQKQKRILERGVDVLVATPGRLWDIIETDEALADDIKSLQFLVLDEADRMIETGHFAELDNILQLTQREFQKDKTDADFNKAVGEGAASSDEEEEAPESAEGGMQTFVFSATLSKDLQRNLKKRRKARVTRKGDKPASTLDDLLFRLDFRDPEPQVVDIAPEGGVVSTLVESKIECVVAEKDAFLYYFLLRYPGRTLIFMSAIDGIRRLLPLLELLGLPAFPLHSQLEQRQRLKNLDRFKTLPNAVLLATDIAARGLDVPEVDHVVHYQVPRTADAYVHRNGRTARAKRSGFALLMCAPDERRVLRALLGSLNRQETEIPDIAVDHHLMDKLKARLQLAKDIDKLSHQDRKAKHERNWLRETAEAMDLELDSDFASDDDEKSGGGGGGLTKRERKTRDAKAAGLRADLRELLAQPLVARGVMTSYITSGSTPIVDDLLAGHVNQDMIGVKVTKAGTDLVAAKKRKKKAETKVETEEWHGFGS